MNGHRYLAEKQRLHPSELFMIATVIVIIALISVTNIVGASRAEFRQWCAAEGGELRHCKLGICRCYEPPREITRSTE